MSESDRFVWGPFIALAALVASVIATLIPYGGRVTMSARPAFVLDALMDQAPARRSPIVGTRWSRTASRSGARR
jgi:hypothetical protein